MALHHRAGEDCHELDAGVHTTEGLELGDMVTVRLVVIRAVPFVVGVVRAATRLAEARDRRQDVEGIRDEV